jgi:hypothetical protein
MPIRDEKMSEAMPERRRFRQTPIALFGSLGVVNPGLESLIESAVKLHFPGDCLRRFCLGFRSFAPGQMAARQLLDMLLKARSSRPLLLCLKTGLARQDGVRWVVDRRRRSGCRQVLEPILSSGKVRASRAPSGRQKLEEPLVHDAARPGVVQLKIDVCRYLQGGSFRSPVSTIISIFVSLWLPKVGYTWSNWSA